MANPLIAIERKQLLVDWWNRQSSPTFLAAARATGMSQSNVPLVLEEMGVQIERGDHSSGKFRAKLAAIEELTECLQPLWNAAYAGAKKDRVFVPPRFPWVEIMADDEHGAFLNPGRIDEVIQREGGKNVGFNCFEVLTQDAVSRFRKTYHAAAVAEVASCSKLFDKLNKSFDVVRVGRSNHTQRFVDFIANKTDNVDAIDLVKDVWKHYFDNVVNCGQRFQWVDTVSFQVGQVLMAHMKCYMAMGATTVRRVKEHCEAQVQLGFKPPFAIVAQGHTHRLSDTGSPGYPCRLWEVGCMCHVPEYALDPEKPMACTTYTIQNGYGRIEWNRHGEIYWPETRTVNLGVATVPEVA